MTEGFTQKLSNLKLEELERKLKERPNGVGVKNYTLLSIKQLLSLPYHETPGWKELTEP